MQEAADHLEKNHLDKIPKSYKGDVYKFLYDYRNERRRCQICGVKTQWNPKLRRYNVLCSIPDDTNNIFIITKAYLQKVLSYFKNKGNTCSDVMRKNYINNIKRTHGTDNLMADPEYNKMLLENRSIASVVKYNGKDYTVIGSYEKTFVEMLDKSNKKWELQMPGPTHKFEDGTFTIIDAYLPQFDLCISIKDMGNNPNYINNYKKASKVFYELNKHGKVKIIELNGIDSVKSCVQIIEGVITGKYNVLDVAPVYMERYAPDLYNKLKK